MASGELVKGTALGPATVLVVALCTSVLMFGLFYLVEIRKYTTPRKPKPARYESDGDAEDADVAAERARVAGLEPEAAEAAVRIKGLGKSFFKTKNPVRLGLQYLTGSGGGPQNSVCCKCGRSAL